MNAAVSEVHLHDPQTLYRHWEEQQWSPFEVDLAKDVAQWLEMGGDDRDLVFWVLSSLMVAEERITTKFSGLVGAYGSEEEATFLATQQVDEARHMQFYARFQDEVVADPGAIGDHVARARDELSPSFAAIFDEALVQAHERLVAQPADAGAKVDFVTTYHMVIEGTLGLTAFEFITRYLEREGLLPGLRRGLQPHPPRRAAPHRLRHLVPAPSRAWRPRARRQCARDPPRPPPRGRRGAEATGSGRRRLERAGGDVG